MEEKLTYLSHYLENISDNSNLEPGDLEKTRGSILHTAIKDYLRSAISLETRDNTIISTIIGMRGIANSGNQPSRWTTLVRRKTLSRTRSMNKRFEGEDDF
jgi:hypothetical protein